MDGSGQKILVDEWVGRQYLKSSICICPNTKSPFPRGVIQPLSGAFLDFFLPLPYPFHVLFPGGYLIFRRIHMINLRFGRPTNPSNKIFSSNPSIYQNFLHKVKSRCQFLLSKPSIYKISHFFGKKLPTHLSTSAF